MKETTFFDEESQQQFVVLDAETEKRYREAARMMHVVGGPIPPKAHPVVRDECRRMEVEHDRASLTVRNEALTALLDATAMALSGVVGNDGYPLFARNFAKLYHDRIREVVQLGGGPTDAVILFMSRADLLALRSVVHDLIHTDDVGALVKPEHLDRLKTFVEGVTV